MYRATAQTCAARLALGVALLAGSTAARPRRRRLRRHPARARIAELHDETSVDAHTGAVRSVQQAELLVEPAALAELWSAANLERLARTYWRFLSRVTLGLIRVRYDEHGRSVVLVFPFLRLLSFRAPEYEVEGARGLVRWRIARGLLVARHGHDRGGYLQIEVVRGPIVDAGHERLHVEVAVEHFYPSIASRLSPRLYDATQSRIHVLVTYAFLRSLARLDLAESRVGSLSA